ncbi:pyrroline-5-carboxylate reductase [Azomonas agilis]|uniref:Pyrroline-5-carboxylate reductase n=1 Tax=Azomonas agilis TaxID=116849 RepID=A0A562IYJ5_9GAMM|nr:pyrroline-5-carboxylate reductase [Azomonas agilis]TWH76111.1 pyrroline-5-carboxylate reductase [Azomonas agilis]
MKNLKIAFVGAGNMATSLIGGLRAQGMEAKSIRASAPGAESRSLLNAAYGVQVFTDNQEAVAGADIVVLAVKPQIIKSVCLELANQLPPQALVVSIAAGITCNSLQSWLGVRPVVRCMPNTPALLRQGVSGLFASFEVTPLQRQQAEKLLLAVGQVLWVDKEAQMDAVTAVSGSGPAYFFLLMEAMIQAGQQLGLSPEAATHLTLQTALGAACMACDSDVNPDELRRRVTSPNGTTEAAIKILQNGDFEALVSQALTAAAKRSAELATQLGQ